MATPDETPEPDPAFASLEAHARAFIHALRETRPLQAASQLHQDQMLTWAIGLMGAGLFSVPSLLGFACTGGARSHLLWIAAPWTAGILFALVGRVVAANHRDADNLAFVQKWQALETMLLRNLSFEAMKQRFLTIMNNDDPSLAERAGRAQALGRTIDYLYYATHIAFGLGLITAFWRLASCL